MKRRHSIRAKSWRKYKLTGLAIAPSLSGAVHTFLSKNRQVEVRLPKKPKGAKVPFQHDSISTNWYKEIGSKKVPLGFDVHTVNVLVSLSSQVTVPDASIGKVNFNLFTRREGARFDRLVEQTESVSDEGFEYWLKVIRWISQIGGIGQPGVIGKESGWATYLLEEVSEEAFYSGPLRLVVPSTKSVSKRQWNAAQTALSQNLQPPIWFDFLFEGEHRLHVGDLHGAVISLAVACESLLRVLFFRHAKRPPNKEFLRLVNYVSVSRILSRWRKLGFSGKVWERSMDRGQLQALFDCRNQILHGRGTRELNRQKCKSWSEAARKFILHGDNEATRLGVV